MKRLFAALLGLVLLLGFAMPALAEDPPSPMPFTIESEDGERVFIFNPGNMFGSYPSSGLYYNTEPPQPIYTLDSNLYWAFEHSFVFSEDLQLFVLIAPMAYPVALEFYANGALLREYGLAELVGDMAALPQGGSAADWLREHELDPETNLFSITTVDGLRYVFDLATGAMTEGAAIEPSPEQTTGDTGPTAYTGDAVNLILLFAIIGGGVALVVIIDMTITRRRMKRQPPQAPAEDIYFDFR